MTKEAFEARIDAQRGGMLALARMKLHLLEIKATLSGNWYVRTCNGIWLQGRHHRHLSPPAHHFQRRVGTILVHRDKSEYADGWRE